MTLLSMLLYSIALFVVLFLVLWNLAPVVACLWYRQPRAIPSMLSAGWKGVVMLPVDLSAPFFVAIALLFTKRSDDKLPWLFTWWDNDVSINGDQAENAPTYYAPGHDRRSYYARWKWLVRNRASRLAQMLGYTYAPGEYEDTQHWGTITDFGDNMEGWAINRRGGAWQIFILKRIPGKRCYLMHFGYKVWQKHNGDGRPTANVVAISYSRPRWKGV